MSITVYQGGSLDVVRTVTNVPGGETLTKAWLTIKKLATDADPGVLQKVITSASTSAGQITNAGGSGTGALLFTLASADTAALVVNQNYVYDVQVLTSGGRVLTLETSNVIPVPRVTAATT
jgi:hypothetical protein